MLRSNKHLPAYCFYNLTPKVGFCNKHLLCKFNPEILSEDLFGYVSGQSVAFPEKQT